MRECCCSFKWNIIAFSLHSTLEILKNYVPISVADLITLGGAGLEREIMGKDAVFEFWHELKEW